MIWSNAGSLPAESKALVNRLVERGEEEQSQIKNYIYEQVRVLSELDVPKESDVASLEQRIATLEKKVVELEGSRQE